MLNSLYSLATDSMANAQVSINNASNNIANADTAGYSRTEAVYETSGSTTYNGVTVGLGATIVNLESQLNTFLEAQYLAAYAELCYYDTSLNYLDQMNSLFDQEEDSGLNYLLNQNWLAWNELSSDPTSLAAREALLGYSENLIYELNNTSEQIENTIDTVESEIASQVSEANELIDQIAALNEAIVADSDNTQLIAERTQALRDLDALVEIDVTYKDNGEVLVDVVNGSYPLVDGDETHYLEYAAATSTDSLVSSSTYDGEISFSGSSAEEITIEFVSSGPDGTAQFKVSYDGGVTWETDDSGNEILYTADDSTNSVTVDGVEIWFDGGTTDHAEGDQYTIVAKSGLYWEAGDGSLVNVTPSDDISNRLESGSIAGLFDTRDQDLVPTLESLDSLAEALIWETNVAHSQGTGTEPHTAVTGTYAADDSSATLENSGLYFADNIEAGELTLVTYDADGNISIMDTITVDPTVDTLDSVVAQINATFGPDLSASVNADGQLELSSATDMSFEIGEDTSYLLAACGVNTYYTGTDAGTIDVNDYVVDNVGHINCGAVDLSDGTVASGSNDTANAIYALSEAMTLSIGGQDDTSFSDYLAAIVSDVGSAASSAEIAQASASSNAEFYYDQQQSASGVNVDEELVDLTKYQNQYEACAKIIEVTQTLMQTALSLV